MQLASLTSRHRALLLALGIAGLGLLPGCAGALIGGGGLAGMAVAQERPMERGVQDVALASELRGTYLQTQFEDLFLRIKVLVVEGRVLLTGTVRTEELRAAGVELAEQTEGVVEVLDQIQVAQDYGILRRLGDTWISTTIRAQLVGEFGTEQIDFWTTTHNAVVYLIGIAENEAEIQLVTEIARNVKGVAKVVNYILLRDDPRRLPAPEQPAADQPALDQPEPDQPATDP